MRRSGGFSLVELMVAMVIGLIIILGAGQLFLTVFQTSRQVETLSEKQAAVNFAVETLLRDIRRADPSDMDWNGERLRMEVVNRGDTASCDFGDPVRKSYRLSEDEEEGGQGFSLMLAVTCNLAEEPGGFEELVAGLSDFRVDDGKEDKGVWIIYLDLIPTDRSSVNNDGLIFHAVNRTAAVTSSGN